MRGRKADKELKDGEGDGNVNLRRDRGRDTIELFNKKINIIKCILIYK